MMSARESPRLGGEVMKKGLVVVALILLTVPVAHAASPGNDAHAKGTQNAKSSGENPAKACKTERTAIGFDAFAKKYGTNHNLRNAFGKCVSGKSKQNDETEKDEDEKAEDEKAEKDDDGSSKAVKQCRKQRADMGTEAFSKKYGTNHNKANAFGKCVSSSDGKKKDKSD
jgi:hypothetical protein